MLRRPHANYGSTDLELQRFAPTHSDSGASLNENAALLQRAPKPSVYNPKAPIFFKEIKDYYTSPTSSSTASSSTPRPGASNSKRS
jgi:hypothetical protein